MSSIIVSSNSNGNTTPVAATTSKEKDLKDNNSISGQSTKQSVKKKKSSNGGIVNGGSSGIPVNSKVYFFSSECKYSVIIDRVKELDWRLVEGEKYESRVNLIWVDVSTIHEHFRCVSTIIYFSRRR